MTVVQPNSIAGINSITVQNGNSLAIHKSDGSLIRTITGSTGVTTFATLSVGTGYTDFAQGGGLNIGLGASISNGSGNVLTFGTGGDDRATIDASGNISVGSAATISANGNATFSGIVTASSFVGDGSGLTGAGPTLTGSTNNTLVTVTGANAIAGEANLTFDGNKLGVNRSGTLQYGISFAGAALDNNRIGWHDGSSSKKAAIGLDESDDSLNFYTGASTTGRLRITSAGNIGVNTDVPAATTHISKSYISGGPTGGFDSNIVLAVTNNESASNYAGLALNGGASGGAFIHFGDTADSNIGILNYDHGDDSMRFSTNAGERLRITSAGAIGIAGANYGSSGQVITSGGSSAAVSWATPASSLTSQSVQAEMVGDQTMGTGAWNLVKFNAQNWDTGSNYDHSTGEWKYQAPSDGKYWYKASAKLIDLAADKEFDIALYKSTDSGGSWVLQKKTQRWVFTRESTASVVSIETTGLISLDEDDLIRVYTWHNHGSNRDLDDNFCLFEVFRLGD